MRWFLDWLADSLAICMAGVFMLALAIAGTLFGIGARLELPGDLAQIESLRRDVQKVRCSGSEDVAGQVSQWNQKIAANQRYNRTLWADIFVPDGWDEVEPIDMPTCWGGTAERLE